MPEFIIPPIGRSELEPDRIIEPTTSEIRSPEELKKDADNNKHDRRERIFEAITKVLEDIMSKLVCGIIIFSTILLIVILILLGYKDWDGFMALVMTVSKIGFGVIVGIFMKMGIMPKTE